MGVGLRDGAAVGTGVLGDVRPVVRVGLGAQATAVFSDSAWIGPPISAPNTS